MSSARLKAYINLLIVVVIWGIAPSVIKFGLGEIPPFTFLAYRFLITTILMLPFYLKSTGKGLKTGSIPLVLLISFLGSTLTLGLLFYGTNLTTSLDSSLISATTPIFVAITGAIFLHERITHREKIGIAFTLVGTIIVALQSFVEVGGAGERSVAGNLLILASNVVFTAYLLLSKEALRKGVSAMTITFMMFFIGFLTTIPLAVREIPIQDMPYKLMSVSVSAQFSVLFMAIASGAVAYYLYQKAQKSIEASEAAVFTYLTPLVTAPVGVLWLHEKITPPFVLGSVIIALGVFLAEIKKRRYN